MIKAEKVKISQLALILLIVIPGGKYLSLPSYMSVSYTHLTLPTIA